MLRKGYHCKYKNKVFMCAYDDSTVSLRSNDYEDVRNRGFEDNPYYGQKPYYWQTKYRKIVPKKEVEWFCRIRNQGMYKGRKIAVIGETDTEYIISSGYVSEGEQLFTEENGFEQVDRYLFEGKVPKSEVTDVKEGKEPINKKIKAPDDWNF